MNPYPGNVVFHRVPAMNSMVAHSKLVFNRFFWRSLCGWGVSVTQLAWLITWHILRKTGWRRKTRKTAKKYRSEKNQYLEKVPVLVLEEFFFGKKYWSSYRKHFNFFLVPYSWIICPLFCWAMCKLRKMEVAHVGSCASGCTEHKRPPRCGPSLRRTRWASLASGAAVHPHACTTTSNATWRV